jgi:hypothetical protein
VRHLWQARSILPLPLAGARLPSFGVRLRRHFSFFSGVRVLRPNSGMEFFIFLRFRAKVGIDMKTLHSGIPK